MGRGEYRGEESIYNKWKSMDEKLKRFSFIYNRISNNERRSGMSDVDVIEACKKQYLEIHHQVFNLYEAWTQVNSSPKWHTVPTSMPPPPKRSKTTSTSTSQGGSDAHCQFNLNDDPDFIFDDEPEELPRPVGRDRAKATARGGQSSSRTSSSSDVNSQFDMLGVQLREFVEEKKKLREERKMQKDLNFLAKDLSHLDPNTRAFLEQKKAEILARLSQQQQD